MARRRNRGFFFYGFWACVLALAFIGGSALYHQYDKTTDAASTTLSKGKELGEEGLDKALKAIKEAKEAEEAKAKKEASKEEPKPKAKAPAKKQE